VGPLDALAAPHRSRSIERFFALRRARNGVGTLSAGRPAAAALARLRAGGWIAALADRGCRARRRMSGLRGFVPIDRAPLLLARRARARVLAGVSWRGEDGALHVRFLEPFSLAPTRGGLSLPQAAARLQQFFDDHVRAHPAQWYEWTAPALSDGGAEAGA
jgi:lauroyl/myristoyl acyltransferase